MRNRILIILGLIIIGGGLIWWFLDRDTGHEDMMDDMSADLTDAAVGDAEDMEMGEEDSAPLMFATAEELEAAGDALAATVEEVVEEPAEALMFSTTEELEAAGDALAASVEEAAAEGAEEVTEAAPALMFSTAEELESAAEALQNAE